ncbi:OmpA family protein [Paracoccaceae bacterium Fryx2]|nr:OmpA family protein [Paracoccaceae bacterium Fryx2]
MKPKADTRRRRAAPVVWHIAGTVAAWLSLAAPGAAMVPEFPAPATPTANRQEPLGSYRLPIGPWSATGIASRLTEGRVDQTAWRIDAPGVSTLALLQPLRAQITRDGYRVLYECETAVCGGYDFRYGTDLLPEPDMHVDLGDFRYLAAERSGPAGHEQLSLIVSRSAVSGFVQVTRVGPPRAEAAAGPVINASTKTPLALMPPGADPGEAAIPSDLMQQLESGGSVALEDLVFPSGMAELAPGDYGSLAALAEWLRANPGTGVALVGHTDASGGLEANVALSRKRAESVRQRLIGSFGLPAGRITAEGVGYLAPRDSNQTEEGRTRNRRVEVILTSTR